MEQLGQLLWVQPLLLELCLQQNPYCILFVQHLYQWHILTVSSYSQSETTVFLIPVLPVLGW